MDEFQLLLNEENPDVVCVSEHNLKDFEFSLICLPGFNNVTAFCRQHMQRGGVGIFVREVVSCETIDVISFCREGVAEFAAVKLQLESQYVIILAVYRPPINDHDSFFGVLSECLDKITRPLTRLVVVGDFNVDMTTDDLKKHKFINIMSSFGLKPTVRSYTREFKGSKSLIDNVCTDFHPNTYSCSVVISALSDHHAQTFRVKSAPLVVSKLPHQITKRFINDENTQYFNQLLKSESWQEVFSSTNTDTMAAIFFNLITFHFNIAFPLKRVRMKNVHANYRIGLSSELRDLLREVKHLYYLSKDLEWGSPLRTEYRRLRAMSRIRIRAEKAEAISKKLRGSSNMTKAAWEIVNANIRQSKISSNHNYSVRNSENVLVQNPHEVANLFNSHFISASGSKRSKLFSGASTSGPDPPPIAHSFFLTPVTREEVINIIKTMKPKSSSGPDGISSRILKVCYEFLIDPFVHLINHSFSHGQFPEVLKYSIIQPLHKKGSKDMLDNFRPITLISTFSKIIEKAVFTRLMSFIQGQNILFQHQYGFLKNKSTADAMFYLSHQIVSALDDKSFAASAFIDLSKAFDSVNHDLLLSKLQRMGIRGIPLDWFRSYICGRRQVVRIAFSDASSLLQHCFSEQETTLAGVPQGSVLGPLLFLLFINDIGSELGIANVCLFADDTTVTVTGPCRKSVEINIFTEVNKLIQWCHNNDLRVNTEKTCLVDFSIRSRDDALMSCIFGETEVQSSVNVRFLGVELDQNLKFHRHIEKVARSLSGGIFILRNLARFTDVSLLLTVYYGVIYPHLAYCVPVWGAQSSRTHYIFRLQKRAVRTIFRLAGAESCRSTFKQYKILTFPSIYILETLLYVKRNLHIFTIAPPPNKYHLRPRPELPIPKHRTTFSEHHLLHNGIRLFNQLPASLKQEVDLNKFKVDLKAVLINTVPYKMDDFKFYDFRLMYLVLFSS